LADSARNIALALLLDNLSKYQLVPETWSTLSIKASLRQLSRFRVHKRLSDCSRKQKTQSYCPKIELFSAKNGLTQENWNSARFWSISDFVSPPSIS
jgi:hypothetical protein